MENRSHAFRFRIQGSGNPPPKDVTGAEARYEELGHHCIVFLLPGHARIPEPDRVIRETLHGMNALGIRTGEYNLPDWEPSPAGLRRCLDSLFGLTPPTVLFLDQPCEFIAAQQHLAERGIFAPRDVSMICADDDPSFAWHERSVLARGPARQQGSSLGRERRTLQGRPAQGLYQGGVRGGWHDRTGSEGANE
ncbi:hypothetical protein [Haloferula sp. A504]|uniref:hypothetical protein n=1 Tax=Haloferula sp. A504 TaxID=3373601 RepID=UPI0031C2B197|nr:substrate-binding domain-containing protein [Verrucomicrobiaceae bacterium E54]